MEKPDVDSIEGLSPAISIEQKTAGHNPRSTVGTVTEIYDYLRLLWARAGTPHCPNCGRPVQRQSAAQIAEIVLALAARRAIEVRAPLVQGRKGEFRELFETVRKQGFIRAYVDGELIEVAIAAEAQPPAEPHDLASSSTGSSVRADDRGRLADSIETALKLADGVVEVSERRRRARSRCSPSATAARAAASRCPSSSRATSRSTRRSARARRAVDSARGVA